MDERDVEIQIEETTLAGTLAVPDEPWSCVGLVDT